MSIKCNATAQGMCLPRVVYNSQGFLTVNNWHSGKVDHCNCPHFTEEEIVLHSGNAHLRSVYLCYAPRYFPGVVWGPITNYPKELLGSDEILWNAGICKTVMIPFSRCLYPLALDQAPLVIGSTLWMKWRKEREEQKEKGVRDRVLHPAMVQV